MILHIEDDPSLGEIIKLLFEGFGFRGTTVTAPTVADAEKVLDEHGNENGSLDLIISDMNLPDGTGLDVVRYVRGCLSSDIPIVILSGDVDARKVGRAYALGANAYVPKMSAKRSTSDIIKTLYDHWARDAVLPSTPQPDRAQAALSRAIAIRARRAQLFHDTVQPFADQPSEAAFWLGRVLIESNLANILQFLRSQIEEQHIPADLLDVIEQEQTESQLELDTFERKTREGPTTIEDVYRRMLDLVSILRLETISRSISCMFPIAPVAVTALRDLFVSNALAVADWIEVHTHDPDLHDRAARLQADVRALSKTATR